MSTKMYQYQRQIYTQERFLLHIALLQEFTTGKEKNDQTEPTSMHIKAFQDTDWN